MPVTAVTAPPFIIEHPVIQLGDATTGVEIACGATNLDIAVDQDTNTVDTFCGSYTSYKAEKWTITVTLGQSYGTGGTWTLVQPLVGTIVPFVVKPDTDTASVDNPAMSGNALVKAFPFISAAPGEASEVDLELAVQGQPLFGITDPTGTSTTSASSSAAA